MLEVRETLKDGGKGKLKRAIKEQAHCFYRLKSSEFWSRVCDDLLMHAHDLPFLPFYKAAMRYLYLQFSSINQVERGRAEAEVADSRNLIRICEK